MRVSKEDKAKKITFEVVDKEDWMEFRMQRALSPLILGLIDQLKKLSSTETIKTTLQKLGYKNKESAQNCLRAIGKKFNMRVKVVEKDNDVYVFVK